jgi:hypothetical protein
MRVSYPVWFRLGRVRVWDWPAISTLSDEREIGNEDRSAVDFVEDRVNNRRDTGHTFGVAIDHYAFIADRLFYLDILDRY